MKHQIIEPQPNLASLVKCYWNLEIPREELPGKSTIVPDGCIKMIFHYGDKYLHHNNEGDTEFVPDCLVVGQLTQPYVVEPTGDTATFFVCFHPNGFLPFATLPLKEIENKVISFEELYGSEGKRIGDAVLSASSTEERIKLMEEFLLNRLANTNAIDRIVQSTVETILSANGTCSVDLLSKQNNTNRRQLSRKFFSDIGLSPKQLSKTIRLQATLKALLTEDVSSLTSLAYDNEYYDQAHFIKEFKEFTGLTPKEFYGDDLKMSLVFDGKK